jgi:hypothetical protein
MILKRYYLWLVYHWIKWWRKKDRWKRYILEPMGMCVYCNSTWICIPFFFIFVSHNILLLPLFIGMNYIWIEILKKYINI